jgi:integrase
VREPRQVRCPKSARYPRGVKWSGSVEHRGRQRWVGTFATRGEWMAEALRVEAELRAEAERGGSGRRRVPTVREFLAVSEDGLPLPGARAWPWSHPRETTKESTRRTYQENIRRFAQEHGDRRLDSFDRVEARRITASLSSGQKAAVRRMFGDAEDDGLVDVSRFRRLSVKQPSRLQRGDFRIVTDAEFAALQRAALRSRTDRLGELLRAMIALEGTLGIRPSEIFGIERQRIDYARGEIELHTQIDEYGAPAMLKGSERRIVPLPDEIARMLKALPELSERWLFVACRGGVFKLSLWHSYWNPVRVAAGLPDLPFYELKHRAITRMGTPRPHGLGLDPRDIAQIVGHHDGGATIARHYLQLDQRQAVERFHTALRAVQECEPAIEARARPRGQAARSRNQPLDDSETR